MGRTQDPMGFEDIRVGNKVEELCFSYLLSNLYILKTEFSFISKVLFFFICSEYKLWTFFSVLFVCLFVLFSETGSHYVALTGLELALAL